MYGRVYACVYIHHTPMKLVSLLEEELTYTCTHVCVWILVHTWCKIDSLYFHTLANGVDNVHTHKSLHTHRRSQTFACLPAFIRNDVHKRLHTLAHGVDNVQAHQRWHTYQHSQNVCIRTDVPNVCIYQQTVLTTFVLTNVCIHTDIHTRTDVHKRLHMSANGVDNVESSETDGTIVYAATRRADQLRDSAARQRAMRKTEWIVRNRCVCVCMYVYCICM